MRTSDGNGSLKQLIEEHLMQTERTLNRTNTLLDVTRLVGLMALGLAIPAIGLPQWLTGPLVNALLLLTVEWVGVNQAILVGMVTPLSAAMSGVLPLPLLAMIPFIAMGNATLVSVYGALRARNRWLALGGGAVLKFALLATVVTLLVARPLSVVIAGQAQPLALPVAIVEMMRWPQLATALAGGLIAFGATALARRNSREG
jgi:hypothetical protein